MKQLIIKLRDNSTFGLFRRKIVVLRSFMARSYSWIQSPGFILILVGVMYPYISPYVDINIWLLSLIILVSMLILGFLERYLGFFTEEARYNLERNTLMLGKLSQLGKKIDMLEERLIKQNGEKKEVNKEANKAQQERTLLEDENVSS